jgi:FAD synthetase
MANKNGKRKVVLASGVFDLLHLGHVRFLEAAKKAGGENAWLVVVVACDSTVEKTKGKKPIMSEEQRVALVESLRVVDRAVLGFETLDIGEIIASIKPEVIALGYDQEELAQQVQSYVGMHKVHVAVVRIDKFEENSLDSSTKIKQKIIDKLAN